MDKFLGILNISWEFIHQYWPFFMFFIGFFFTRRLRNNKSAVVIPLPNKKELVIEEQGSFDFAQEQQEEDKGASGEASETSRSITNENLITTLSQPEVPDSIAVPAPEVKKKVLSLVTGPQTSSKSFSFKKAQSFLGASSSVKIDPSGTIKNRSIMRTSSRMGSKLLF